MTVNSELTSLLALSQTNPNIEGACGEKGLLETNRETKRKLCFASLYQDHELIRNCWLSHNKYIIGKISQERAVIFIDT